MSDSPKRAEEIFMAALEIESPQDRSAYVDEACEDDASLRNRVVALLQAHAEEDSFLVPSSQLFDATSVPGPAVTTDYRPRLEPGTVISERYTLREKIGEGGMGEVWVAKQSEPVQRRVALKLIKTGMDSKAVLQRFEQERKALAMMDHPNIARVLDAGMTASGQPFFVMELVNGLPLGKFCDEAKMDVQQRLELFVAIGQAVQHAHQKGIVHRDLKPANILVTMIDGKPVPKVIDFGVAKAFGGKLTEDTMTQFGAVVGTLEYMSPEQAGFSGDDVDTRADIYSLGVMLYELLTGLRPIDKARMHNAALTEMIRIIREEEPSKPSTRLSTDAALPSLAAVRRCDPRKLTAMLRGELDWVVMKCLEKNRDRRYETASSLVRDIQRYLTDEPVEARPPSAAYRTRKFLKRHKGKAVAAALMLLTLMVGIAGTTFGLFEAKRQEQFARDETAEKERARLAEATERERAVKAEAETKQQAAELSHGLGVSNLLLAGAAYEANNVKLAADWLRQVPAKHRGWGWNYLRGQVHGGVYTLRGHKSAVSCVAFSPDGTRILTAAGAGTAGKKGVVKLWDARTGQPALELSDPPGPRGMPIAFQSVAFSPDGRRIVAGGVDTGTSIGQRRGKVIVWDVRTGKTVLKLGGLNQGVTGVAFSPDGDQIATAMQGTVALWDSRTGAAVGKLKATGPATAVWSLAFSPDGKRIATKSMMDGTVAVWDLVQPEKPVLLLNGIALGQHCTIAFSPDGTRIVTGKRDGTAIVLDAQSGEIQLRLKGRAPDPNTASIPPYGVLCAAFSPDGSRIVTGGGVGKGLDGDVMIWDAITGELLLELKGHTDLVASVAFSPDGEQIVSGSADLTVKVWDARTGCGRFELSGHKFDVAGVAISRDGKRLVSVAGATSRHLINPAPPGEATIWDLRTGQVLQRLAGFAGPVRSAAFSPDGARVFTGGLGPDNSADRGARFRTGQAIVWDAHTGKALLELKGLKQGVNSIACSPNGKWIATAGDPQMAYEKATELKIWNARTGKLVHDLTERHMGISPIGSRGGSVAFSPDGRRIVAGGMCKRNAFRFDAAVFEVDTGKRLFDLIGHRGPIACVAFSPDGQRIITGGIDRTVRLWDARTGKFLSNLKGHRGSVLCATYSPDGRRILTGGGDKTLRIWDVRTGKSLAVWKRHVGIINSLAFTRDGRRLVTGASWDRLRGAVTIWNARPLPSDAMRPVVPVSFFSLDGKRFVIERDNVKQEARPRVGDTDSEKILCKLEGHYGIGAPGNLGFSPDGRRIVGLVTRIALMNPSGMSGQLIVWDAATGKALLKRKWTKPGLSPPAFSLDGKRIVVRSFGVEKMKPVVKAFVLDSQTGKEVRGEAVPKTVQKRTAGPDGRFLARVAGDNVVLVSSKPDADEIEYRRIQTQPRVWRYRKNYLSARLAAETSSKYRKQYEFAAMFYLNLFAEDDRPALVAEGDALVSAKLPRRGAGQRNRKAIQPIPPGVRIKR